MGFDIHLATDRLSPALEQALLASGFTRDEFLGGTEGVLYQQHWSLHPGSRDQFDQAWLDVRKWLETCSEDEFCGYAEAEIVGPQYQTRIPLKAFDPTIPLPFGRIVHERCPAGKYKTFDVHISADLPTLDNRLQKALAEGLGLYMVDIRKANDTISRVFSFQPMEPAELAGPYFRSLENYLLRVGGMSGKVKMEVTHGLIRFPHTALVPLVTTKLPPLNVVE